MATERDPQAELEREIAAFIRNRLPQAAGCEIAIDIIEKNNGAPGEVRIKFTPSAPAADGAEESADPPAKPAPTKREAWGPDGELSDETSSLIYPEGGEESLRWRKSDFNPVKIRGKPLSETVIEDRGPETPDTRDSEGESERPAITRPPKKGMRNFNPVKIGGKPLSETVMEERRNARY